MKLTLREIAQAVAAKNNINRFDEMTFNQIEFDSRKIKPGDLFLPLKGARDGHDFIDLAFKNGAAAAFSEKELAEDRPYLLVDDTLSAFQKLAAYYLEKTGVDVIAVTGSNGKTTTKDMLHDILATTYKTYKTQGNYNNEIGLPYTVLHMPDDTEKIVLEMGQDHLGDIKLLSELAKPKTAIVTLIGEAHLEFFGSRDKIAEGKMQITDGMPAGSLLLVPDDPIIDPYLLPTLDVVRFGENAELSLSDLSEQKDSLTFKTDFLSQEVYLPVPGKYNATNALVAAYAAKRIGVSEDSILYALRHLQLTKNRTEWKKAANGADILSDVYNANPTAMKLILETFSSIPANDGGKKIAVLADMKELGEQSLELHTQMITSLLPDVLDTMIFYGEAVQPLSQLASQIFPLGHVYYFKKTADQDQFDDLISKVKEVVHPKDQVLLKGSHSMKLDEVVQALQEG
ncbi:UDP-N-acetylmuramoyl-tripeptide--D-alanyl-D-alanine ligase [Streptococcus dentiloxodontae]